MPSVLREHQHELSLPDGSQPFLFGTEDTGYLTLSRPMIVGGDSRLGDVDRSQEDGRAFSRDYRGAKSYTFEIGVLTDAINALGTLDPHRANLDALNTFEDHWEHPRYRNGPQAMAMLRSCEAGRTSRCYGRPRRYDEAAGKATAEGYTPVVASFDLIDNRWYADTESVADFSLQPSPSGGFTAPVVAPITTTLATSADYVVTIGGAKSTWPVVEFHGPVIDHALRIGNLTLGLVGALAYDHVVTIDCRPWRRTVTRAPGNVGLAGWLSRATPRLAKAQMEPGTYDVTFSGRDTSGAAWARLRWRDARSRP